MAAEVSDARGVHLGCRSAQAEAHKDWSECMRKAAEEVGVRFFLHVGCRQHTVQSGLPCRRAELELTSISC